MDVEELRCNIVEALQNEDHTILQKWVSSYQKFRSSVASEIEKRFHLVEDDAKRTSVNTEKMSEIQQEINQVKSNIDDTALQQKVIDKKISNVIKSQESLKEKLDKTKTQKDDLSLKMTELQIEIEERKGKKILHWDAIKRACMIYKVNLDIHMSFEEEKDCQNVKISFFMHKKDQETYFVQLSHSDNQWRVERIEPKLKKEHLKELTSAVDTSEHFRVSDITLFLCQIRDIYLKYYMTKKIDVE